MSKIIPRPAKASPVYGPIPPLGLPVQVQCDDGKRMAFLDREGRWVDLFSHEYLACVRGVILS